MTCACYNVTWVIPFPNITNFDKIAASDCVKVNVTAHICFIGSLHTPDKREFTTLTTHALKCDTANMHKFIVSFPYVGGSSKIQTLCHMTQVLLKLRFTTMERLTDY